MESMTKKPLYLQIYDYLLEMIHSEDFDATKRLPSEKELAQQFNVSRITSKKALTMLSENGIIERMQGRGSYVSFPKEETPQPQHSAARLKKKPIIGVILTEFTDSFGTGLLYGIEQEADNNDHFVCLRRSYESQQLEEEAIEDLLELGVEGLIILPIRGKSYNPKILKLVLEGFPLVMVGSYLKWIDASFTGIDNVESAKLATDYLLHLGHKNIAFLSPPPSGSSTLEDRLEGFIKSFSEHAVAVDRSLWLTELVSTIPRDYSEKKKADDIERIRAFLEKNPQVTSLFAAEYNIALLAEAAVREMGKSIPDDISILCFDGPSSFTNNYFFTHVRQNEIEMGNRAVQLLLNHINHDSKSTVEYIQSELVKGQSTRSLSQKS